MVRPDSQRGKRTSSKAGREGRFVLAASSTLMFAIASINAAMAAPTGAQFNPNEIKISQQGKTTLIDQSTQRAIINWKGFDVSADEAVRFNQPGVTSSTLNRVTAGQESVIAGRISAPGQVIIYNSNGVVFSGSAKVDVGSLITTTANISDEHFRQGKLIFDQPGNPDARIVNDGSISVAEKGLAAFVAPSVANNGVINARLGTVAMAAGNAATIDLYGDGLVSIAVTDPVTRKPQDAQALVSNGGAIQADGGSVLITAEQASRVVDNAVNLSGVILARGTEVREGSVALVSKSGDIQIAGKIDVSGPKNGGDVLVSGQQVALASTASIDARGAAQGGSVRIGGDFQGRGELPRAKNATLAKGASIDVSATGKGNGGLAVVWSDGNTRMDGRILARGGAQGGNGGLVETSGKVNLSIADSAYVSVAAPYGMAARPDHPAHRRLRRHLRFGGGRQRRQRRCDGECLGGHRGAGRRQGDPQRQRPAVGGSAADHQQPGRRQSRPGTDRHRTCRCGGYLCADPVPQRQPGNPRRRQHQLPQRRHAADQRHRRPG